VIYRRIFKSEGEARGVRVSSQLALFMVIFLLMSTSGFSYLPMPVMWMTTPIHQFRMAMGTIWQSLLGSKPES